MRLTGSVLVTGATGFVGCNLVCRLVDVGMDVTCLLRSGSSIPAFSGAANAFRNARIVRWDWESETGPPDVRVDWIFHLAAAGVKPDEREPALLRSANVDYPLRMVALARDWGARFVLAGSSAEYADPVGTERMHEDSPTQRDRLYGSTKALGTESVLVRAGDVGVAAICCRLFGVYGPGEADYRLFPSAVRNLAADRPVALSSGTQVRDFISVSDVCSGLIAAAGWLSKQEATNGNGIMNLCTGEGRSVREFAEDIARVLQKDASLIEVGKLPLRADDVPYLVGNPDRLIQRTGWRPTPHAAALAREVERTMGSVVR